VSFPSIYLQPFWERPSILPLIHRAAGTNRTGFHRDMLQDFMTFRMLQNQSGKKKLWVLETFFFQDLRISLYYILAWCIGPA
jgi:hypothetical protein